MTFSNIRLVPGTVTTQASTLALDAVYDSTIYGTNYVGGYMGYGTGRIAIIDQSIVDATIYGSVYVGGVVGYLSSSAGTYNTTTNQGLINGMTGALTASINYIKVSGGSVSASGSKSLKDMGIFPESSGHNPLGSFVGGIVGYMVGGSIISAQVSTTVTGSYGAVGGIAGSVNDIQAISYVTNTGGTIKCEPNSGEESNLAGTGGLVGYWYSTTNNTSSGTNIYAGLSRSTNYADVSSPKDVGGLIGGIYGSGGLVLYANANHGNLTSNASAGGIAGSAEISNLYVSYNTNSGDITATLNSSVSTEAFVGGLFGYYTNSQSIEYSYNVGTISASSASGVTRYVGALLGRSSGSVEHTYYLSGCCSIATNIVGTELEGKVFTSASTYEDAFGDTVDGFISSSYVGTTMFQPMTISDMYYMPQLVIANNDKNVRYDGELESYIFNHGVDSSGNLIFFIESYDDLYKLANAVNKGVKLPGKTSSYASQTYYVLSSVTTETNNGQTHTIPIGTDSNPFTGSFISGTRTVSGDTATGSADTTNKRYITVYQTDTSQSYKGLFGKTDNNAKINYIAISATSKVYGASYVGGIVGCADNTKIQNCENNAEVKAYSWAGGICGSAGGHSTNISSCINNGTISGIDDDSHISKGIGGIV